ncbi:NucA/NucB deoxyribonuclease domain-containing protein [Massilia sp. TWP1-3-3]|uniref:NucA/NucB deoxyribonuclease domain-containing protein n=1 Tax=Massilia sp. TWP1-3-3 TaxID=2804573 RepID=UPI003CECBFE6
MLKRSARLRRTAGVASCFALSVLLGGCGNGSGDDKTLPAPAAESRLLATSSSSTLAIDPAVPPTIATTGCTGDADFYQADFTPNPNALINRHVLCVRDKNTASVDVKNAEGDLIHNAGEMKVETYWSVYGGSVGLKKQATLTLRYTYTDLQPALKLPVPTLKIKPRLDCVGQETDVTCGPDAQIPMITLSANGQMTKSFSFPITWDTTTVKKVSTTMYVKLFYTTDGSVPVYAWSGATNVMQPLTGNWDLRCDKGVIKSTSEGCVFPGASAIWRFQDPSGSAPQARKLIADAFSNFPEIPGKFRLADGMRSVASSAPGYMPLTRTFNETTQNANRYTAGLRCDKQWPVAMPPTCSDRKLCDCDEYPPAAALEGARSVATEEHKYTVNLIPTTDNRSGGGQMLTFFNDERVDDNENFWVYLGNITGTPPPPPPPPSGPKDVTSSFTITRNYLYSEGQDQKYNFTITNNAPGPLAGPFRLYFKNLPVGVMVLGSYQSSSGVFIAINEPAIVGSMILPVTIRAPSQKFSFTTTMFSGKFTDDSFPVDPPFDPRGPAI